MTKTRAGRQRDEQQTDGAQQQKKNPPALTNRQARTEKIRFALYLKLALLMGLGWVGIFYAWEAGPPVRNFDCGGQTLPSGTLAVINAACFQGFS